jgi:CHAT domain-containing protein
MKKTFQASIGLLALVLTGCPEGKPAVSLEQAKLITANFSKQGFVAPPRTVNDILALLEQEKPDPARALKLQQSADAQPDAGLAGIRLARFYADRGQAAAALGRTNQQIEDLSKAVDLAQASKEGFDVSRLMQMLSYAHGRAGNRAEAIRVRKEQQKLHESTSTQQGRLFGVYSSMISMLADQGDLQEAKTYLETMQQLLTQSRNWGKGQPYALSGVIWEAQSLTAQAAVAEKEGKWAEAENLRRSEMEWIAKILSSPDPDWQRFSINRDQALRALSRLLLRQNRAVEAEIEARRALLNTLKEYGRYAPETAESLITLTNAVAHQGRYADAEKLALAVIDIYQRTGHGRTSWSLAAARSNLAMVQYMAERTGDSLATYQALVADISQDKALLRRTIGGNQVYPMALLAGGRNGEALDVLKRQVEGLEAVQGPEHAATMEAKALLAVAQARSGQREAALATFRQSLPSILASASQAQEEEQAASSAGRDRRRRLVIESYIGVLASGPGAGGSVDETFRIADTARSQVVQRSLSASAVRALAQGGEMADLVRREQDSDQQLAALQVLQSDLLSLPSSLRDEASLSQVRSGVEALRSARQALRLEIASRFPAYAELRSPPPVVPSQVQSSLREGEALIAILVGAEESFVWAVPHKGKPAFARVPLGKEEVSLLVAKLRVPMEAQVNQLGDLPAYDFDAALKAYQMFLAPVEGAWRDAKSLLVVADRALGQLPFSILVTEPYSRPAERPGQALMSSYQGAPWLVRKVAVTQLPSVGSLIRLRQLPASAASRKPFIGFADPWFNDQQAQDGVRDIATRNLTKIAERGGLVSRGFKRRAVPATLALDSAQLKQLPRLPETAEEVISVALALRADPVKDVFLGKQVNDSFIRAMKLDDRKVVMFATHGLVPGDVDGLTQPALALTHPDVSGEGASGLLTMDNVLGLKLDADWVVLSACNTASGEGAGAEAVSGLGRAFFYAGTRALLVTHWAVESSSAAEITTGLFRRAAETPGLPRAEALRQTMLSLIDGPGAVDPDSKRVLYSYAHPIFWAPYALVGDGGG